MEIDFDLLEKDINSFEKSNNYLKIRQNFHDKILEFFI